MFGTNIIFIGSMFFVTEQFQHCLFKIPSTDGFSSKDHLTFLAPLVHTFSRNSRVRIIKRETRPERRKKLHEKMLISSKIIPIIFFYFSPIFPIIFFTFPYFPARRLSNPDYFFLTFPLFSGSLFIYNLPCGKSSSAAWIIVSQSSAIKMSLRLFLEITNGIETFKTKFFVICNKKNNENNL